MPASPWIGSRALGSLMVRLFCGLLAMWLGCGCASPGYRFGRFHPQETADDEKPAIVVERGKPHKTLDRLAWLVGIPSKIFTLNPKTNNHVVSEETIAELTTYLEENDLQDVYVAVNDYNPKLQWQRLRENKNIAPFWKYTAGVGAWLSYTFVPNRVFGGDEYIPYTNTIIVSSDVPVLVLAEAAYAKDIHGRDHPGLYATVNDLPIVSLWRHSRATSDVLCYARSRNDWESERQAYETLYPQIGSTTFGPTSHFVPVAGPFLSVMGAAVGQVAGRTVAKIQEPVYLTAASKEPPAPAEMKMEEADTQVIPAGFEQLSGPE